jgi:hypothetical protein
VVSEDTKFPEEDFIEPWFQKMMADFPNSVDGIVVVEGRVCQATLDVPPEVTRWFNKWFGQFVEGA